MNPYRLVAVHLFGKSKDVQAWKWGTEHWHRQLRAVVESLFLEVSKNHGDVALGDEVSEHSGMSWGWACRSEKSLPILMIP